MSREIKRGTSRKFGIIVALICAGMAYVSPAWADFTSVSIGTLTTADLRTYSEGSNYPVAPTTLNVGGVDFDLVPYGTTPNSLGIIQLLSTGQTATIAAHVANPTTVYTLMNSSWGSYGADIATLEFYGSGGAFASFELVEGTNIRDHYNYLFNNIAVDVVTATFANDRLDRQAFTLPSSFADETLTEIRFIDNGWGASRGSGQPFMAAITVETPTRGPAPVPLPGAALLGIIGCIIAGWRFRNRRVA